MRFDLGTSGMQKLSATTAPKGLIIIYSCEVCDKLIIWNSQIWYIKEKNGGSTQKLQFFIIPSWVLSFFIFKACTIPYRMVTERQKSLRIKMVKKSFFSSVGVSADFLGVI